jgi:hypothetical protein
MGRAGTTRAAAVHGVDSRVSNGANFIWVDGPGQVRLELLTNGPPPGGGIERAFSVRRCGNLLVFGNSAPGSLAPGWRRPSCFRENGSERSKYRHGSPWQPTQSRPGSGSGAAPSSGLKSGLQVVCRGRQNPFKALVFACKKRPNGQGTNGNHCQHCLNINSSHE